MSIAHVRPVPTYPEPGEASTFEVTYDDFMAMPETNRHVEVVDGVIYVMPGPRYRHQKTQDRFGRAIGDFVELHDLGVVLQAPSDVLIRKRPKLRVRQPDLLFISNRRAGFRAADDLDRVQDLNIPPDLVIEILSPGQDERTLADKLTDYASIEVEEVWFADQAAKSVRVLARVADGYRLAGEFRPGDRIVSAVLPGIDLDLAAIFG